MTGNFAMTDGRTGAASGNGAWDEDAELLWQATTRAEALLEDLDAGRPAAPELDALLGYLREVVLARITEEERYVFTALREADPAHPGIEQLHHDHLLLREDIDTLAAAAAAHGTRDPGRLAALARGLIISLEQHLRSEAAALAELGGGYRAGATGWAARQHWYPLTEGPVINLDWLGADHVDDAVLNRLTHLRAGEQVELVGHSDPERLWRRLQRRSPGGYGWSQRRGDLDGWRATVERRPAQ